MKQKDLIAKLHKHHRGISPQKLTPQNVTQKTSMKPLTRDHTIHKRFWKPTRARDKTMKTTKMSDSIQKLQTEFSENQ